MIGPRECHTVKSKSERENKYCILMHMCGIYKNGIDDLICKKKKQRHRHREQIYGYQMRKGKRVGRTERPGLA